MSLGNSYNNNAKQNQKSPSVYSPYKFNNAESPVDKTNISFSFWNNQLKITIAPRKANTDQVMFDYDNGISIYLNHSKARIFAEEIKLFLSNPDEYDNNGVNSGQGLITISTGKEFKSPSPLIVIRKIDENGKVMASFAYQTKHDYYFAVRNYNEDGSFGKDSTSYENLELLSIITLLEEFYKASTGAVAYSVIDQTNYMRNHSNGLMSAIANKLGVEYSSGGGSRTSYNSKSYFNSAPGNTDSSGLNTGYTQASLDDID